LPNNTPRDLSGNQLSQAPRHTLNFGAEKEVDTNIGKFVARLEGRWTDQVYFTAFNIDAASRPPNTVLNSFLTYTPNSGAWTVRAYVRNLTNKYVVATQYVGGAIVGYPVFSTAEPPRLFGGAVTYRF
jgi:iron complex outermembrane receptor protein